jgi:hypothetical protein
VGEKKDVAQHWCRSLRVKGSSRARNNISAIAQDKSSYRFLVKIDSAHDPCSNSRAGAK